MKETRIRIPLESTISSRPSGWAFIEGDVWVKQHPLYLEAHTELKALREENAMCKRLLFESWNNGLIEPYDLGDGTYRMAGDPGEGTFPISLKDYTFLEALTNLDTPPEGA